MKNTYYLDSTTRAYFAFQNSLKGINIKENEQIVIESKNHIYIFKFAIYIEKSNKQKLLKALLDLNDVYYINMFLKYIINSESPHPKGWGFC